ncbi:MAG: hypothetical protein WB565_06915 [Acidimicrobiales bacterium]
MILSYDQWAQDLLYLRAYFDRELMDCRTDLLRQDELAFYLSVIDARLTLLEPHLTAESEVGDLVQQVQSLYSNDVDSDGSVDWTNLGQARPPSTP